MARNTPPRARPRAPLPIERGQEVEIISVRPGKFPGWFDVTIRIDDATVTNSYPGKDELDVLGTIMRVGKAASPWE